MANQPASDPVTIRAEARRGLLQALFSPSPRPLLGAPRQPGLFGGPPALARLAGELCVSSGWVEPAGEVIGKGGEARPLFRVTDAGAREAVAGLTQPAVDALRGGVEEVERMAAALLGALAPLRAALGAPGPAPPPTAPCEQPLTRERLRATLRQKYDELHDRAAGAPVALPPLFDRAREAQPGLSVERFHDELLALRREQVIDLHPLDDDQRAERREVGIYQKNTLYYFVEWKAESPGPG